MTNNVIQIDYAEIMLFCLCAAFVFLIFCFAADQLIGWVFGWISKKGGKTWKSNS